MKGLKSTFVTAAAVGLLAASTVAVAAQEEIAPPVEFTAKWAPGEAIRSGTTDDTSDPVSAGSLSVGTAVSTNTESPHTTGLANPLPGIFTFQRMFLSSLHVTGGSAFGASPVANGPRHAGQ